jgi:hypothetical protein
MKNRIYEFLKILFEPPINRRSEKTTFAIRRYIGILYIESLITLGLLYILLSLLLGKYFFQEINILEFYFSKNTFENMKSREIVYFKYIGYIFRH